MLEYIVVFPCRRVRNCFRIRFSPNRRASSSTRSPCGLSCHSTSTPRWFSLAGSHHLDSPCFRSSSRHHFGAAFLDLVGRLHCALTPLGLHVHGAYLPPCTTSCCHCACLWMHPRGSPLQGASTVSRKRTAYSPRYTQQFGMPRTSMSNP